MAGLARSLHDRLLNEARERNRPFTELLELFAVERFLHRLGRTPHRDVFVLKGALLLRQWLGQDTRPTRDIDLLGPPDLGVTRFREILSEILHAEVEDDGIEFDEASIAVRPIRVESPVLGMRATFAARLGPMRLRYQVDVGFGETVFPPAVELAPGGLLGLPMATVRAYTAYTTIAEKLEAMVVLGGSNSRMKDYYDLYELPRALSFDGALLVESIRRTFARRGRLVPLEPPEGLSESFAIAPLNRSRWQAFIRKSRLDMAKIDLAAATAGIRRFAQPALNAAREGNSFEFRWQKGGPWHPPKAAERRPDV